MEVARSFRDLRIHQRTRAAVNAVFEVSKTFPKEERYALTDQIRRSSRAVKAMLAEAWARRRYKAVFIHKLDEAMGEALETQSWLDDALDCSYLTLEQHRTMEADWQSISAMLSRMIDRADDFCKNSPDTDYRLREDMEGDQ